MAPKGLCPVEHRGEFPNIFGGNMSGQRRLIEVIEGGFEVRRADFRPEEQI